MFSSLYRRYYKFVKIVWVFFPLRLNFTSLLVRTIAGGSGWQKSATLNTNAALAHCLCVWAELHMCIHVCWVGAGAQLGSWLSLWTPSSSFFTSHCKTSPYQTPKLLISVKYLCVGLKRSLFSFPVSPRTVEGGKTYGYFETVWSVFGGSLRCYWWYKGALHLVFLHLWD